MRYVKLFLVYAETLLIKTTRLYYSILLVKKDKKYNTMLISRRRITHIKSPSLDNVLKVKLYCFISTIPNKSTLYTLKYNLLLASL